MRLAQRRLRKLIRESILLVENQQERSKKIDDIISRNFEYEIGAVSRKLYSNSMTDRIRSKIQEHNALVIEDSGIKKAIVKKYGIDVYANIFDFIIPKDRAQRFENVADDTNPYYLNAYPAVVSEINKCLAKVKVDTQEGIERVESYFLANPDTLAYYLASEDEIMFQVDNEEFSKHLNPTLVDEDEVVNKISKFFGLAIQSNWPAFDRAINQTMRHEVVHAFDFCTLSPGYDTVEYLAHESCARINMVLDREGLGSGAFGVIGKTTEEYEPGSSMDWYDMGAKSFKDALKPVIDMNFWFCFDLETASGDDGRCQYLNIHDESGQTEVRARIINMKAGKGVGPFTADMIADARSGRARIPGDSKQLLEMIRSDATNQEIADAFNAVIPPG